jgi:hypothetical protein
MSAAGTPGRYRPAAARLLPPGRDLDLLREEGRRPRLSLRRSLQVRQAGWGGVG